MGESHSNILATYLNDKEDIISLKLSKNGTFTVKSLFDHLTCSKSGHVCTLLCYMEGQNTT